jgi:hypothetical protein
MSEQTNIQIDPNQTQLFEVEVPISEESYSPYQCAKVINEEFVKMGVDKVLPPQMFYTYTKKNMIPSYLENNKKFVKHSDLVEWFVKYCKKNNIK